MALHFFVYSDNSMLNSSLNILGFCPGVYTPTLRQNASPFSEESSRMNIHTKLLVDSTVINPVSYRIYAVSQKTYSTIASEELLLKRRYIN